VVSDDRALVVDAVAALAVAAAVVAAAVVAAVAVDEVAVVADVVVGLVYTDEPVPVAELTVIRILLNKAAILPLYPVCQSRVKSGLILEYFNTATMLNTCNRPRVYIHISTQFPSLVAYLLYRFVYLKIYAYIRPGLQNFILIH
jgi:hypothetical protein